MSRDDAPEERAVELGSAMQLTEHAKSRKKINRRPIGFAITRETKQQWKDDEE